MPKAPIDYSRTVIYKLVCNDLSVIDCYIGHTIDFIKRKNAHKTDCCNSKSPRYNLCLYQFIRNNGGFLNWSMIEIEKYPCIDRQEASKRERYWFENLGATLNKQVPSRTLKQYKHDNKDRIRKEQQSYDKERRKEITHCGCGGTYNCAHKTRHYRSKKHIDYIYAYIQSLE